MNTHIINQGLKVFVRTFVVLLGMINVGFAASYPPIEASKNGLVVSTNALADEVGQKVLDSGGNAIDAAVAVGYALAVVHPSAGNIGGGGFALIHLASGETVALDFRERAPKSASKDMYLDKKGEVVENASVVGHLGAGVPGTVKGMSAMLERYGTKSLKELLEPAITLADKGFLISAKQSSGMSEAREHFLKFPASKKYFLKLDGSVYKGGERLIQKDLAKTLKLIAKKGQKAFYQGEIADLIAKDMAKNGGIITKEDLVEYEVIWRKPVQGTYRGYKILSMSPPSSGGTHIVQILNTIENVPISKLGFISSQSIHIIAEAMRQAYADRAVFMGDPDFVKIPLEILTSKDYAKKIYANIKPNKATPSAKIRAGLGEIPHKLERNPNAPKVSLLESSVNFGLDFGDSSTESIVDFNTKIKADSSAESNLANVLDSIKHGTKYAELSTLEKNQTTHYSVADKWGNAVSVTYTINGNYGSYAAVDGAGFLLNNEMDDFSIKTGVPNLYGLIGGEANAIEPYKRPLSSMSPTIILDDNNQLFMVVGSPGGARIITTVLQVIINVIDFKMDIARAVDSPRFHLQWLPDELRIEKFGLNEDTKENLIKMGYNIVEKGDMGDVNAILIDKGKIYGSHDPRKEFE